MRKYAIVLCEKYHWTLEYVYNLPLPQFVDAVRGPQEESGLEKLMVKQRKGISHLIAALE